MTFPFRYRKKQTKTNIQKKRWKKKNPLKVWFSIYENGKQFIHILNVSVVSFLVVRFVHRNQSAFSYPLYNLFIFQCSDMPFFIVENVTLVVLVHWHYLNHIEKSKWKVSIEKCFGSLQRCHIKFPACAHDFRIMCARQV